MTLIALAYGVIVGFAGFWADIQALFSQWFGA